METPTIKSLNPKPQCPARPQTSPKKPWRGPEAGASPRRSYELLGHLVLGSQTKRHMQFSKLGSPFGVPTLVRHASKEDPKRDPNLENYPRFVRGMAYHTRSFREHTTASKDEHANDRGSHFSQKPTRKTGAIQATGESFHEAKGSTRNV